MHAVLKNRPDFSEYVAHFCKEARPYSEVGKSPKPTDSRIPDRAIERLENILQCRTIYATPMPWTDLPAVCFTECPWWSFSSHAEAYSPFGIGFHKKALFGSGGGPAIYLKPDLLKAQMEYMRSTTTVLKPSALDPQLTAFTTPFSPAYAPPSYKRTNWPNRPKCDYAHEREWRVIQDFQFEYDDIAFIVVATQADVIHLAQQFHTYLDPDKFLSMEMYRRIETLWPTHLV